MIAIEAAAVPGRRTTSPSPPPPPPPAASARPLPSRRTPSRTSKIPQVARQCSGAMSYLLRRRAGVKQRSRNRRLQKNSSKSMRKTMNTMHLSSCWSSICIQWCNHLVNSWWWYHRCL